MRVLICGGRDFDDAKKLSAALDALHLEHGFTLVIHGGARGADRLAGRWAERNAIKVRAFLPDWDRYGNAAGPMRNGLMLTLGLPELVVAFPGKNGTADMIRQSEDAGIKVIRIE
jgi:hypothetical protein